MPTPYLDSANIESRFQPIVHIATGRVVAHEALSRGRMAPYETAAKLFDAALADGQLFHLEILCRELAIRRRPPGSLFLNVSPHILADPQFRLGITRQILDRHHLSSSDVVFEVTEREAVGDYASFCAVLAHYRSQGFRIAVDDVGAGYANLLMLAEVLPEFIKVDLRVVQGVAHSSSRAALIESLLYFAQRTGATLIAEGVEEQEDLDALKHLGVPLAQGYLLGRPQAPAEPATGIPVQAGIPVPQSLLW